MKKLNVLILTPFFRPNIGGVETHLDDLCKYLGRSGHHVFVVTYQPLTTRVRGPKVERKNNLEVRRISWFGYKWFNILEPNPVAEVLYLFPAMFLYSLFFMLASSRKINVVHTQGLVASLVGKFLKLFFRRRYIATVHTIYYLSERPLLRRVSTWILSSFDRVLFVSRSIMQEFVKNGIVPSRAKLFTYWADDSRFRPLDKSKCRKVLGLDGEFVVLFVGRLVKEKGVDVLMEIANMSDKRVRFVVVTSGSIEELKRMVGANLPANVIYVGPVEYSRLHLYYNAADLLILPSQYREGFSRVVLESALCGTPVVASRVGCLPEIVTDEVGVLVNPPTPRTFYHVIEFFFNDRGRLCKLFARLSDFAREMFTETNAKIIEEAYYS